MAKKRDGNELVKKAIVNPIVEIQCDTKLPKPFYGVLEPPMNYDYLNIFHNFTIPSLSLSPLAIARIDELKCDIQDKENQNKNLIEEIEKLHLKNQDFSEKTKELEKNYNDIQRQQKLIKLTSKIHLQAANKILTSDDNNDLIKNFESEKETENVIMSIDIRHSTDLMLNARNSENFASFITELCAGLKQIIIKNYGVFDKFTGDGILAYFPLFYSGDDAIHKCCVSAKECHNFFIKYYRDNRKYFKINLVTGLGIGIDFGMAKLVRINDEPTIVGVPVVYACRLSCAPSNHTYINQPVYEYLSKYLNGGEIKIEEEDIEIKNQGQATVYDLVDLKNNNIKEPKWYNADTNGS
jgi:class 3 adenylate cyclase